MAQKNNNNSSTKKELVEVLGAFTEDVLMPAMNRLMDDKLDKRFAVNAQDMDKRFAKHTHQMKGYIDSKLTDQKGDIIAYMKGDRERENNWKLKVVDILQRNKLAKPK